MDMDLCKLYNTIIIFTRILWSTLDIVYYIVLRIKIAGLLQKKAPSMHTAAPGTIEDPHVDQATFGRISKDEHR